MTSEIDITKPLVLQEDVVLIPCAELDPKLRSRIAFDDGDFTLAHRRRGVRSEGIDGGTAALLTLFREPRTIVSAVIENSRTTGADPRARFDEVLPPLAKFVEEHVLVQAGSAAR